jgi:hypothetical protein
MSGESLAAIVVLPRIDVATRRIRKQIAGLSQERAVTASVVEQAPAGVGLDRKRLRWLQATIALREKICSRA